MAAIEAGVRGITIQEEALRSRTTPFATMRYAVVWKGVISDNTYCVFFPTKAEASRERVRLRARCNRIVGTYAVRYKKI